MNIEDLKLEILKECQRQMILKNINVKVVFDIGRAVREKYDIKYTGKTMKEILEESKSCADLRPKTNNSKVFKLGEVK